VAAQISRQLELVEWFLTAFNDGDTERALEHVDPSVRVDWSQSHAPYAGVYTGFSGWRRLFGELRGAFGGEAWHEVHEIIEEGRHVAVYNTVHLLGREGIEVTASSTLVFTFEDDKLTSIRLFQEHADALEAMR
jgi:ketosteroid isomerase-like protein